MVYHRHHIFSFLRNLCKSNVRNVRLSLSKKMATRGMASKTIAA